MPRAVAYHLPREMAVLGVAVLGSAVLALAVLGVAVLGVVELALAFAAICRVIQAAAPTIPLPAVAGMLPHGGIAVAAVLIGLIGAIALTVGLYRPEIRRERKHLLIATGLAGIVTFAVLYLIGQAPRHGSGGGYTLYMAQLIATWCAAMALIRLTRGFALGRPTLPRRTLFRLTLSRRVLLIGDPEPVGALSAHLRSRRGRLFDPVVHHGGTVSWPLLRQQRIRHVVVASEPRGPAAEALLDCKLRGMPVSSAAAFHETCLGRIDLDRLTTNGLLLGQDFAGGKAAERLKRLCDVLAGTVMLVLLLPLMALTALAIRIDSPGPALYRQQRVGQFDTTFTLFKFRSMTVDAEAGGSPRWAQQQDPRVTRIGRFIRSSRIDELPQLANVIRGEMSMVGPRPERPHFVEQLARAIPFYRQRAYVKPGLTGWAQVNFPYGASVEDAREKLAYDLYYVKNRTIRLDVGILISTIRVVLFREGAR
jgi:exopolysaccharide biosynthesis polyprenyl glycosylphosphotransferase